MLSYPMAKKDTQQFHIRPSREVVNRLEKLSEKFDRDSANQIAVEILRDYADLWEAAEQTKRDTILRQQEALTRAIQAEALRRPIHEAAAESGNKQAQTKKGRR